MRHSPEWFSATIASARDVADNVREIEIKPEGGVLPFPAGSHLDVKVKIGARMDIRSYSLVGEAGADCYRIAVRAQERSRGGSLWMWSLACGDAIELSAPIPGFELEFHHPAYLLIAAGIGVTPLVGMAAVLARRGAPLRFLFAGRSRPEMAYLAQLRMLLGDRLEVYASAEGRRLQLAREIAGLPARTALYLCGPLRLLEEAQRVWRQAGRSPAALRYETFGFSGGFGSVAFLVELPRLGISVEVPENVSMLDALAEAGVQVLSDCKRGECGLCALDVIAADCHIEHRDVFLSDREKREGRRICACVSRLAGGRIVIDPPYRPD